MILTDSKQNKTNKKYCNNDKHNKRKSKIVEEPSDWRLLTVKGPSDGEAK